MASSQTDHEPSAEGANNESNSTGVEDQALMPEKPCTTTKTNADTEDPVHEPLFPLRPTRLRRETKVPYSTIDDAFEELRKEGQTPTVAFLSLLSRFKLPDLKNFTEKINCSFSNVTYEEIAPLFGLEPFNEAKDMRKLTLHRSRLPTNYINRIVEALRVKERVLGPIVEHANENARVRYLDGLIDLVVDLFGETIRNKPEQRLVGAVTKDGAIEYQFVALSAIIVVFMEVKRVNLEGDNLCKAIAQVMAESDACDVYNEKNDFWVPIRGILTDGVLMYFFEFRSDTRTWMKSDLYIGLPHKPKKTDFVIGVRRMSELLFDFLLMGYIDGLEARCHQSVVKSRKRNAGGTLIQGEATRQWMASLEDAREGLKLARQSHEMMVTFNNYRKKASLHKTDDHKYWQDPKDVTFKTNALSLTALEYLRKSIANAPIFITSDESGDESSDEYDETEAECGI